MRFNQEHLSILCFNGARQNLKTLADLASGTEPVDAVDAPGPAGQPPTFDAADIDLLTTAGVLQADSDTQELTESAVAAFEAVENAAVVISCTHDGLSGPEVLTMLLTPDMAVQAVTFENNDLELLTIPTEIAITRCMAWLSIKPVAAAMVEPLACSWDFVGQVGDLLTGSGRLDALEFLDAERPASELGSWNTFIEALEVGPILMGIDVQVGEGDDFSTHWFDGGFGGYWLIESGADDDSVELTPVGGIDIVDRVNAVLPVELRVSDSTDVAQQGEAEEPG